MRKWNSDKQNYNTMLFAFSDLTKRIIVYVWLQSKILLNYETKVTPLGNRVEEVANSKCS